MHYYNNEGTATFKATEEVKDKLFKYVYSKCKYPKYNHSVLRMQALELACIVVNEFNRNISHDEEFEETNSEFKVILYQIFGEFHNSGYIPEEFKLAVWDLICLTQLEVENTINKELKDKPLYIYNNIDGKKFQLSDYEGDCSKVGKKLTWDEAHEWVKECNLNQLNGYSDWRLPTRYEMSVICSNDTLEGYDKFVPDVYWTSTETRSEVLIEKGYTNHAYKFYFHSNVVFLEEKDHVCYVRVVRDI